MMTVFFYARLWRRCGVLTDLEFYELRYSGRPAAFVRGFRAIYLGLFFNCVIMATVTLAAVKIANVMLGWERLADRPGLRGHLHRLLGPVRSLGRAGHRHHPVRHRHGRACSPRPMCALRAAEVGGLSGLVTRLDPPR